MDIATKHTASSLSIFAVMTRLANEHQACNLSQGLPDYPVAPELGELLREAVSAGFNQYAPMPGLGMFREKIAADLNKRYRSNHCSADIITITPGATYGIFTAMATLIRPGDEVVYLEPAFDCYRPAIEINGGVPVAVSLKSADGFALDFEKMAAAITPRTRALLINTPHNPTGYVWTQQDWQLLATLVAGRQIYVISDEVYDHLVFDGQSHAPGFLQEAIGEQVISIYSFGKAFHITGWKMGYIVACPQITAAFRNIHQYLAYSVSTPAQYALMKYLEIVKPGAASDLLQEKRDRLINGLLPSRLRHLEISRGTYFQLYDYSAISELDDLSFAQWLTVEHKIATIPLSAFYKSGTDDRIVRLCFAKRPEVLDQAANLLRNV
ncbi:pyridoxal phosphate-dependent aminotransferase [Niabella terrae]